MIEAKIIQNEIKISMNRSEVKTEIVKPTILTDIIKNQISVILNKPEIKVNIWNTAHYHSNKDILDKIKKTGDGTKYLSDNGEYKEILQPIEYSYYQLDQNSPTYYYFGYKEINGDKRRIKRVNKTAYLVERSVGNSDYETNREDRIDLDYGPNI